VGYLKISNNRSILYNINGTGQVPSLLSQETPEIIQLCLTAAVGMTSIF
jgi:hypothetical protein